MMQVICAWCRRPMGQKMGPAGQVSHGICPTCAALPEADRAWEMKQYSRCLTAEERRLSENPFGKLASPVLDPSNAYPFDPDDEPRYVCQKCGDEIPVSELVDDDGTLMHASEMELIGEDWKTNYCGPVGEAPTEEVLMAKAMARDGSDGPVADSNDGYKILAGEEDEDETEEDDGDDIEDFEETGDRV